MAAIQRINTLHHPGVELFASLTEAELRADYEAGRGVFIAESPKVIRIALDAGYEPVAMLTEERHITGDAADIVERLPHDFPVMVGERDLLASLTGYKLTRGVLMAFRRPVSPDPEQMPLKRVAVMDGVCDTTNVGAIFRSAAALGIDKIYLSPTTCDPLNRRVVRVSMGTVFLIPWERLDRPVSTLRSRGYHTVAMALTDRSIPLTDPSLVAEPHLAIILGTEGDGLSQQVIDDADYTVKIPMARGVDSLNVAAAAAIAFYALSS